MQQSTREKVIIREPKHMRGKIKYNHRRMIRIFRVKVASEQTTKIKNNTVTVTTTTLSIKGDWEIKHQDCGANDHLPNQFQITAMCSKAHPLLMVIKKKCFRTSPL